MLAFPDIFLGGKGKIARNNVPESSFFSEIWQYLTDVAGVVHAYMGQKLLKPYILRVFWLTDYKLFHATLDYTDA